jgi:hypothetical protein
VGGVGGCALRGRHLSNPPQRGALPLRRLPSSQTELEAVQQDRKRATDELEQLRSE